MSIKNQVVLIGNLGGDPETKVFDSGSKNAKFSLATNETFKNDAGETVNQTEWHNIVVWGKRVAVVEKYLQKGSEVCITGKLTYRSYEDKDGVKRHITEIKANEIVMLGGKKDAPDANGSTDDSKEEE
ncbi:MAG: single-stranded DNA-binding protein [Muricauda sp.]|jgi:single-strand DNA-binding protein|nr:single-stranded DNA-binding protein [Allomuricauda sp.]|tara:strand:- start:906 stop:1289 length:384 start_codon:yes stop_codon:yes gene_type:complete